MHAGPAGSIHAEGRDHRATNVWGRDHETHVQVPLMPGCFHVPANGFIIPLRIADTR